MAKSSRRHRIVEAQLKIAERGGELGRLHAGLTSRGYALAPGRFWVRNDGGITTRFVWCRREKGARVTVKWTETHWLGARE